MTNRLGRALLTGSNVSIDILCIRHEYHADFGYYDKQQLMPWFHIFHRSKELQPVMVGTDTYIHADQQLLVSVSTFSGPV